MNSLYFLGLFALFAYVTADGAASNPNVWNFQIARKVIAAFQFNGMGMSIWEDQGVENATVVARRQFYVTPLTEFLPNSSQCEYNVLTGANFVSYNIQVWNERLQLAAMDRLRQMQIDVVGEQVQPLPFYQVRVIWNNAQQKLLKANLETMWNSNLQQQSIHRFLIITDDKETCSNFANALKTQPEFFTDNIFLEYSLSASSVATRTLTVKAEHFLNSQLMALLKKMDVTSPERLLTSNDANRLTLEVAENVVGSQVVEGDYVPDGDQLTLKDIVTNVLQLQNTDVGNFTQKMWDSVFWDPVYTRPDKVTSYLNKVLKINQGNHSIDKSSQYSDKTDDGFNLGIKDIFKIGGTAGDQSSSSTSFSEMNAWLLQHNYDVEIKGDIFIPKSMSLMRVNLGVLDRQETIFTKSVQMHHVDAPGTLKVTVGSQSVLESEDIKRLRERLDNLQQQTMQLAGKESQLEQRAGQLEGRADSLEGRAGNLEALAWQIDGRVGQLEGRAGQLEGRVNSVQGLFNIATDNVGGYRQELFSMYCHKNVDERHMVTC